MATKRTKSQAIDELVAAFRASGNQDDAIDNLAAERLGVNRTDLHCLNAIENAGGLTAGELARQAGLTTGAVTGVVDRLERAGLARRVPDPDDRRRVNLQVTPKFYDLAAAIWGPLKADWDATLAKRFTAQQLDECIELLRTTNELGRHHLQRLQQD